MITEQQYQEAVKAKYDATIIINQYHKEAIAKFDERLKTNPIFNDEELIYSRNSLCPCGHGLAYPKDCGMNHYWDCSAVLKGIEDKNITHTGQLPFAFYDVKAELDKETTRGVFKPKV